MMNSKLSMAVAAAVALFATPFAAQAADMPTKGYYKAPPRSVISYYNWTGFYAGINVGYGFGSSDWGRGSDFRSAFGAGTGGATAAGGVSGTETCSGAGTAAGGVASEKFSTRTRASWAHFPSG